MVLHEAVDLLKLVMPQCAVEGKGVALELPLRLARVIAGTEIRSRLGAASDLSRGKLGDRRR